MTIYSYAIQYQPYGSVVLENVLTISSDPQGPLKSLILPLSPQRPPVSAFHSSPNDNKCVLAIRYPQPNTNTNTNTDTTTEMLTLNDLPVLVNYLTTHHYRLDNGLTETLKTTMPRLVIFISYEA